MHTIVLIKTTHKKSDGNIHYTVTCKTNNAECKVYLVDNDIISLQEIIPVLDVEAVEEIKTLAKDMEDYG